jgi:site-specific DNA-methyltransferase (adenine-specific)
MGYHYRSRYEFILFFEKGKRRLKDLSIADIITVPRIRGGYPAEKPVELSEILIRQSSVPGELVVDPFMGSGSVGVAAMHQNRQFAGNDIAEAALSYARNHLTGRAHSPNATSVVTDGDNPADPQRSLALVSA